ncbi:MAG: hypothetical protein ACX93N_02660 [Pseudohaliea sp.]
MDATVDRESNLIKQRLSLYTTAAVSAVFASGSHAATTLSPNAPATFTTPDETLDIFLFDIDGDGTDDFEFEVQAVGDCDSPATSPGRVALDALGATQVADTTDGYAALVSGAFPSGGETFDTYTNFLGCSYDYDPTFEVGASGVSESGFFGVQFDIDGETHNALIQVQFEAGSLVTNVVTACFGSEPGEPVDSGTCIRLSGGGAVAVPAGNVAIPLSLGLLALGGLALYRRQRAHA